MASVAILAAIRVATAGAHKATSIAGAAGTGDVVGGSRRTAVPATAAAAAVVTSLLDIDGSTVAKVTV